MLCGVVRAVTSVENEPKLADVPYSTCPSAASLVVHVTVAPFAAGVATTALITGGVLSVRNVVVEDVARKRVASRLRTRMASGVIAVRPVTAMLCGVVRSVTSVESVPRLDDVPYSTWPLAASFVVHVTVAELAAGAATTALITGGVLSVRNVVVVDVARFPAASRLRTRK